MDLERVVAALEPTDVLGRAPVELRDLAYDTRAVGPGSLFFCVPGARADGHDFAAEAVAHGAVAVVVERALDVPVPQLVVPSSRAAMAIVADEFFGRPTAELEVVGVTGTNGKTTTAFLLFAILAAAGRRPGLLGTIEARVGGERRGVVHTTPEAIDLQRTFREMLDAGDRSCAMEASSHASVQHRLDRVRFSVLIFTNLTQDHLDFHGTMDAYFEAKRRLFAGGVRAAINVGDEYGRRLAAELPEALTFGEGGELGPDGLAGIDLKLRGRFNVTNALGARAAARLLGIDDDAITRGLESVRGVPGRFESIDEGQPFSVIVDYAHTADALANVLRTARDLGDGRLICVFGAGGDRDRDKRPQMGRVVSELADLAIVTSDNPRSEDPHAIIEAILAGASGDVEVEPDRAAAIARAVEIAHAGDVVVIAGKGHEQGQQFAERTLPFDDRDAARDALRKART
jgi:UDP-N-acetylmuramoyl-L-alanyl-D-glutamate--2,6-diaminopimelate ligase